MQRGAPHVHMLLWVKGAPVAGKDSDEDVIDFLKDKISCHDPPKDANPILHRLVNTYQRHRSASGYI